MPAVSKAQARFMRGVESGSIKAPGLSPEKAAEFTHGVPTKNLPERVDGGEKRRKRTQEALR